MRSRYGEFRNGVPGPLRYAAIANAPRRLFPMHFLI